ncbi:hypothetical protein [Streptomyces sp. NPDC058964]|uniref:hypothetical protein n=1 Tax=Streptomyces sp. NPDC058964 TaxID=3346681 RepID=UPI0036BE544D
MRVLADALQRLLELLLLDLDQRAAVDGRSVELRRDLPDGSGNPANGASGPIEGTVLLGLGRDSEARARVTAAHDEALAAFGTHHSRVAEARSLLARIDGDGA